jgi:hypothetical protein
MEIPLEIGRVESYVLVMLLHRGGIKGTQTLRLGGLCALGEAEPKDEQEGQSGDKRPVLPAIRLNSKR